MKTFIILFASFCVLSSAKCKPAAEDRFQMHKNAKRISDSIARVVDGALEEVKIDPANAPAPKPAATPSVPAK